MDLTLGVAKIIEFTDKDRSDSVELWKEFLNTYSELLPYIEGQGLYRDSNEADDDPEEWIEDKLEAIKRSGCKVGDHNNFTGEYRGATHSSCNLINRVGKKIPVFFPNLTVT